MDFSYAQGSAKYRQIIQNDVVVIFMDTELIIRHISPNNDVLGVASGTFSQDLPIKRFMSEDAFAKLRAFAQSGKDAMVIEYNFTDGSVQMPVRHVFRFCGAGFGDGVVIRSYVMPAAVGSTEDIRIAEYETALKYINLIGNLPVGLITHDGNKIDYANNMIGEMLGVEAEELCGETLTKVFFQQGMDAKSSAPVIKQNMSRANRFSAVAARKDGGMLAVNVDVQVDIPGHSYMATIEDATSYKSRAQADSVFRSVFGHVSEAVLLLDSNKTVTWANTAVTALTGYKAEQVAGKSISMLYSDEHRPDFYASFWEHANEHLYKGTVWLRTKNGNMPMTVATLAVKNQSAEVQTYIFMFSHAPDTILLSEPERDSSADELTGLHTLAYFEPALERKLADCREGNGQCAVLLMDIDRFKTINELYGSDNADLLLKQITARLSNIMPEGTVICRSDDEFMALIEDDAALMNMDGLATRLIESMNHTFYMGSLEIDIYVSVGIVLYSDQNSTKENVRKSLAEALALPKLDWRSGYQIYKSVSGNDEYTTLEEKIRAAIIKNEFVLYYLPKVDCRTMKLTGLEALLRWQSPEMGLVSPGLFLSAAEGAGLMPALGELVFSMAMQQYQKWNRKGFTDIRLSMNISSLQLRDEHLAKKFINTLSIYGIEPERIELELTESFAFQEQSITSKILNELVEAGVTIALDDFGTGYSSISLLKKYPISVLKIDRSFVKTLPEDKDNRELVSAMIAMAHSLGMKAVAEGVESMAQFEYITGTDCDEMQGFFIGVPASADNTEELMRSYAESE